jgi:ubiquinone/menaquinone biosynthesis C-methylase UbiE
VSTDRSAEEVFRDHLELRSRGEVELDIERNYDPNVTLIRGASVYRGQDGVRECARQLRQDIGDARVTSKTTRVEDEVAFLEWTVNDDDVVVDDGVDTFVIRDGRIVTKTVHYTVQRGGSRADIAKEDLGKLSPWRESASIDESEAKEHVERLELRARGEAEVSARNEYIRLLGVSPGENVLEIGCGSGAVTRALAERIAPGGKAIGLDACAPLLPIARRLADEAGLGNLIEFRHGDCRDLPFSDASFDVTLAVTTLSHVPNAERALQEMVRVTRSGGRLGIFDMDGDSFLISHPDRACTRKIVAAFADYGQVNSWLMRSIKGMLEDLGIENVQVRGFMPLDKEGYYARAAERCAEVALEAGAITNQKCAEWQRTLRDEMAAGRFIAGRLHVFAWGTRPKK